MTPAVTVRMAEYDPLLSPDEGVNTLSARQTLRTNMIDTHSHIYAEEFDEDREEAIARAHNAGVELLLLPDIDAESRPRMLGDLLHLAVLRLIISAIVARL